jgi:hypothetical protein
MDDLLAYNHFIPQQAIGHRSPIEALASWYAQPPELFIASVMTQDHHHTERDTLLQSLLLLNRQSLFE